MVTTQCGKKMAVWDTVEVHVGDSVQRRPIDKFATANGFCVGPMPTLYEGEKLMKPINSRLYEVVKA